MRKYLAYLKSLLLHKWFVFVAGRYVGVSLWQLLIHDLSKFGPAEFIPYARNFYGKGNLDKAFDKNKLEKIQADFDRAWLYHQNRNPHHWQFWILVYDNDPRGMRPLPMPERYVREMVADWMGAGRAYTGRWDIADWLNENLPRFSGNLDPVTTLTIFRVLSGIGIEWGGDGRLVATGKFREWSGEKRLGPPPIPVTTYHCPDCGCWSGEMPVIEGREHGITAAEWVARPSLRHIGHEILACPCGRELTWFEMEERNG